MALTNRRRLVLVLTASGLVALCVACFTEHEMSQKADLGVAASDHPLADSAAYRGTIGELTYYEGLNPMRVRGYGLVVGLGGRGSSDCPRHVYDQLVQSMYKRRQLSGEAIDVRDVTPEALIHDLDTAVVVVEGDIPPAAVADSRFDVTVAVLPGTQTKSLLGGRLVAVELEVLRPVSTSVSIRGQALATASGPLFSNPFSDGESATASSPLSASVVGGGMVTQARRIRLVLMEPSYQRARRMQDRINAQFPGSLLVADAISPSYVQLRVPDEFEDDSAHFLSLVRALYLSRDPKFEVQRARALAEELQTGGAPHAQISLALEGLGRSALSVLDDLYVHHAAAVTFHAAVAGARLGDHVAIDVLAAHAEDPSSPYRYQAIHALAASRGMAGAPMTLRRLLNDGDPRVQIAAYEGLVQRGDSEVKSSPIAGDNFYLDRVATDRPAFVYVKRSGARRIALFGRDLRCLPPLLYRAPDGSVTLSGVEGEGSLTLMRTVIASGTTSPIIRAPIGLADLIRLLGGEASVDLNGEVTGVGLDYGAIARLLYHLCANRSVNARFELEQPNLTEMFGPARPEGRPESES